MYRYLLVYLLRLFIGPYFCLLDYLTSKLKLAIEEIAQFRTWYNISIKTAVACEISLLSTKVTLEGNHMNTVCLIDIHRSNKETIFIYFWITFTFRLQHSNVCFCWLSIFFSWEQFGFQRNQNQNLLFTGSIISYKWWILEFLLNIVLVFFILNIGPGIGSTTLCVSIFKNP